MNVYAGGQKLIFGWGWMKLKHFASVRILTCIHSWENNMFLGEEDETQCAGKRYDPKNSFWEGGEGG